MEDQSSDFISRAYQIDLYEKAIAHNTIIYLPTGSGKTYIAVLVIRKLSHAVQKSYDEGGKRTIFIVNNVHLVTQNSEYVLRHSGLSCRGYSGDMNVDYWSKTQWIDELNNNQVLVMTAQILVDLLSHGYIQLNRINLIIFDECHRAVNDHPMRQIMQYFEYCPEEDHPRVLGLTGSLLNCNMKLHKVNSTIESLEKTFQAKIATVNLISSVEQYSTNPKERIVTYVNKTVPWQHILDYIMNEIDKTIKMLKLVDLDRGDQETRSSTVFRAKPKNVKISNICEGIKNHAMETGLYGCSKALLLHLIQLEYLKKYLDDQEMVYTFEYAASQIIKLRKFLDDEMKECSELDRIFKYSTGKILTLLDVLKTFYLTKSKDTKFCCIIFVKKRFTAKLVYNILKKLNELCEEYKFLIPDYVVGFSNDPFKTPKEALCISKWNKEALHRFKNGVSNCIIATDVIDEGLDIPNCTLIVRYDYPLDFRAYIQSKGRARYKTSLYTVIVEKNDTKYMERYKTYQEIELYLRELLIGKTDLRLIPQQTAIKDELYNHLIEPYRVKNKNGIEYVLTEQSVISLVNKYCCNLYKSKFILLSPIWKLYKTERENFYQVSLKLPISSPLKDKIYGNPMSSIDDAKRSAAMKVCIQLHKMGELTDDLLPCNENVVPENLNYLFPNWIEEESTKDIIPGTNRKKRHHALQYPEALYGAFPSPDKKLYLHILHSEPMYSVPHDNRHLVFYKLLSNLAGFAILSTKKMPEIPSFPIFMNVGELVVTVKVNHETIMLSDHSITQLMLFHTMVFNQIVSVIKPFMVFDCDNRDNCFLVVPIDEKSQINWDVVKRYQTIERIAPCSPFIFKDNDYELALVTPSYRGSASVYIVTQVCEDITPESSFPTCDFYSYIHYYKERHELNIQNSKQPMLEVKPISMKINCIKPRSMKPGLSKRKRADILEDFEEHLVPELCLKVDFPALYWLKATTLPSILHRILQLLIAEDLRTTIVAESQLGILKLPDNMKWPPLIVTDKTMGELAEPMLDITCDDSIESTPGEPELNGPEIDVLDSEANLYPWAKEQEPPDLDRNIETIQVIDVEYYHQFMSENITDVDILEHRNKKIRYINKPNVPITDLLLFKKTDKYGPDPVQIMQALTTKFGNDAFDLERLETLGDSYLKFIVTLYLYDNFPTYHEGHLTAIKGKIIGNRNLYYSGVNKGIPGRMKVDEFVPMSNFIAPAYTTYRPLQQVLLDTEVSPNVLYEINIPAEERLQGFLSETTKLEMQEKLLKWDATESQTGMEQFLGIQTVPDKAVADCVEALIGVYLVSMGIQGAARLLQWFGILSDNVVVDQLLNDITTDPMIKAGEVNAHIPCAESFEKILDYKFNNRAYLLQAFTHPSYTANDITESYQRLEFLGDAILDFLITTYIYENCGNLSPGALTDLRSALVNNITFACLAVRHGLHTLLLAYMPTLSNIINRFVKFQEERDHVIDDELLWVLLEENECNMAEFVDVPKVLGDIFESLIGAIYLDSGKDLKVAWQIIYSIMHKEIEAFSRNVPKQPVRVIHETQGARPCFKRATMMASTDAVMVPLEVTIAGKVKLFHGFGANKKQARSAAAKQALKFLRCKK